MNHMGAVTTTPCMHMHRNEIMSLQYHAVLYADFVCFIPYAFVNDAADMH